MLPNYFILLGHKSFTCFLNLTSTFCWHDLCIVFRRNCLNILCFICWSTTNLSLDGNRWCVDVGPSFMRCWLVHTLSIHKITRILKWRLTSQVCCQPFNFAIPQVNIELILHKLLGVQCSRILFANTGYDLDIDNGGEIIYALYLVNICAEVAAAFHLMNKFCQWSGGASPSKIMFKATTWIWISIAT